MRNKYECRKECENYKRCNGFDKYRNEKCTDYKKKIAKAVAVAMVIVAFIVADLVIVAFDNDGGCVQLSDFVKIAVCGAVAIVSQDIAIKLGEGSNYND